jgi:hypothetical protein
MPPVVSLKVQKSDWMDGPKVSGSNGHVDKEHTMFVFIHHQIHDQRLWKEKVNAMAPPPDSLRRHQFLTAIDTTEAACLWETPSIDELRNYIDPALEPASTQAYFQVYEQRAVGLPVSQLA